MTMLFDHSISRNPNQMPVAFHVKWKWCCLVPLIWISHIECKFEHLLICSNHCPSNRNYLLCHCFSPSCTNIFGILILSLWKNEREIFLSVFWMWGGHEVVLFYVTLNMNKVYKFSLLCFRDNFKSFLRLFSTELKNHFLHFFLLLFFYFNVFHTQSLWQ